MNKNESYQTTIYKSILTQIYVFLVLFAIFDFYHEKSINKNGKNIFFYQKFVHFGEIFLYIVVGKVKFMFMQMFFSKVKTARHNIANGIQTGSYCKTTAKHATDYSKAVCLGVK